MVKYFFIFLLYGLIIEIASGQTISGKVVDQKTGKPLPYVHIGIVNKDMGTVSNEEGNFQINLQPADKNDILRFSIIGYKTLDFSVENATNSALSKVELTPETYALKEVSIIANKNIITENFGFDKATKTTFGWSGHEWKGTELGVPIKGIRNKLVRSFSFNPRFNLYKKVMFRLNIYTTKNNMPDQSILRENIFFSIEGKDKKWVTIDLKPYQIVIDQDVIVAIEPIKTEGNKQGLFFAYAANNNGTPTFIRASSQSAWEIALQEPLAFYLTVEK
ncbi:MAG: carboxypeptidase-like regulatory domain-containing protein [Saprospiraceae bacterium]|nr:carboxypeptidase-like regulatory domain-containing protein [Saprospiraceae bacterium]